MDREARGEVLHLVAPQDVKRHARGEVFVCIQRHLVCAFARVRYRGGLVGRIRGGGGGGDGQRQVEGE